MAANVQVLAIPEPGALQSVTWAVAKASLCAFAFLIGMQLGASVYETLVITPLWAGALPDSVRNWNVATRYPIMPGNFWTVITPLQALALLGALISMWFVPGPLRKWMMLVGICGLAVDLSTGLFFVPILRKTIFNNGAGLSGTEITRLATMWVNWNYVREIVGFAGWACAISAICVSRERS